MIPAKPFQPNHLNLILFNTRSIPAIALGDLKIVDKSRDVGSEWKSEYGFVLFDNPWF